MATNKIVIVGGGTAGWITACAIAAEHVGTSDRKIEVVLVESPDIPTIGVGEGTWPSMRTTLQKIGLPEDELISMCDASFKQGTCFIDWSGIEGMDRYYHPFSPPVDYSTINLASYWLSRPQAGSFAEFVTAQAAVISSGLAPKQIATPPYAFTVNYAYHFDAGRFAKTLHNHGASRLGVQHISGNVTTVECQADGDITGVVLDSGQVVDGDLFVDCTGQRALLLAGHFGVDFHSVKDILFNDTAIAVQVPYATADEPIISTTNSTAMNAGWIWDIGLQTRRGIGYVYSSAHTSKAGAMESIREYVNRVSPAVDPDDLQFRSIQFEPGYRKQLWVRNCVAVGLSAGFVEPLEASALALIEQSASIISQQLPSDREIMNVVAKRYNKKMNYHWTRIIEFLKLHYLISKRTDSEYWIDCRGDGTSTEELDDKLLLWQQQPPWHDDAPLVDELFPSASYQYVLYGMGFRPDKVDNTRRSFEKMKARADSALHEKAQKASRMVELLPGNRELISAITERYVN